MYAIAWGLSVVALAVYFKLWGLVYIAGFVTALLVLKQLATIGMAMLTKEEKTTKRQPRPAGPLARSAEQRQRSPVKIR